MVEVAFVGTMVLGLLALVGLFAALARSRYTVPVAQPTGAPAGSTGDAYGQWARYIESGLAKAVAFLVGGLLLAVLIWAADSFEFSAYPIDAVPGLAGVPAVLIQMVVAFVIGGTVVAASLYLVTADDGPAVWSLAFLYITLGLALVVVLLLAGSAPLTNPVLYLSALVVLFGFLYGVYTMGRQYGGGHAGAVLVTATVLFVLVVLGITVQLFLSGT